MPPPERDIVKLHIGGRITIPKDLREKLRIKEGEHFFIYNFDGKIILEPVVKKEVRS